MEEREGMSGFFSLSRPGNPSFAWFSPVSFLLNTEAVRDSSFLQLEYSIQYFYKSNISTLHRRVTGDIIKTYKILSGKFFMIQMWYQI